MRTGQTLVDMSTAPPALMRKLAADLAAKGADFADAPIARTRRAAVDGTLSIMVGGSPEVFARVKPILETMGSEITHCGGPGAGQATKLINNMVLFQNVAALAEALTLARKSGLSATKVFETLMLGSADSFALRNHARNAMLPGNYPEQAFSTRYALKDLEYALALAEQAGVDAPGARLVRERFARAIAAGDGDRYWPVIAEHI